MITLPRVNVGVDVAKKHLDIHIRPLNKNIRIQNNEKDLQDFIMQLGQYHVEQVVCEASGGYEALLNRELMIAGYATRIVDPKRIRGFIVSKNIRTKTDKLDAKMIAWFAAENDEEYKVIPYNEHLRSLVELKASLVATRAEEKTRAENEQVMLCKTIRRRHIAHLDQQIRRLEKDIDRVISLDQDLAHKMRLLTSMKGVGKTTASVLLATLPELGLIDNKKTAALVGVCPHIKQSGENRGEQLSEAVGHCHARLFIWQH